MNAFILALLLLQIAPTGRVATLRDLSFTYPPNFSVQNGTGSRELIIDDFGARYEHGGFIPSGKNEILVMVETKRSFEEAIKYFTLGSTTISRTQIKLGSQSAVKVVTEDNHFNNRLLQTAVFVTHRDIIYKIVLSNGAAGKKTDALLDSILSSVRFAN